MSDNKDKYSEYFKNAKVTNDNDFGFLKPIIILALVFGGLFAVYQYTDIFDTITNTLNENSKLTPVEISNGTQLIYPKDETQSFITINTSDSHNYYCFIKDIDNNGKNNASVYVAGGNSVTIDLPLGNYEFYYCTGDTWYGLDNLFGKNTISYKADKVFDLIKIDNSIQNYTVILQRQENGNLKTQNINTSQFPN